MKIDPSTDNHQSLWGWGIAAVYAVFAASTLGFVAFTMTHRVELVAPDYYRQELNYEQQIARQRRASNLTQQVTCLLTHDQKNIELRFPAGMKEISGKMHLYRPSDSLMDYEIQIAPDAEGRQLVPADRLTRGLWRAKITWQSQKQEYYEEFTLMMNR